MDNNFLADEMEGVILAHCGTDHLCSRCELDRSAIRALRKDREWEAARPDMDLEALYGLTPEEKEFYHTIAQTAMAEGEREAEMEDEGVRAQTEVTVTLPSTPESGVEALDRLDEAREALETTMKLATGLESEVSVRFRIKPDSPDCDCGGDYLRDCPKCRREQDDGEDPAMVEAPQPGVEIAFRDLLDYLESMTHLMSTALYVELTDRIRSIREHLHT